MKKLFFFYILFLSACTATPVASSSAYIRLTQTSPVILVATNQLTPSTQPQPPSITTPTLSDTEVSKVFEEKLLELGIRTPDEYKGRIAAMSPDATGGQLLTLGENAGQVLEYQNGFHPLLTKEKMKELDSDLDKWAKGMGYDRNDISSLAKLSHECFAQKACSGETKVHDGPFSPRYGVHDYIFGEQIVVDNRVYVQSIDQKDGGGYAYVIRMADINNGLDNSYTVIGSIGADGKEFFFPADNHFYIGGKNSDLTFNTIKGFDEYYSKVPVSGSGKFVGKDIVIVTKPLSRDEFLSSKFIQAGYKATRSGKVVGTKAVDTTIEEQVDECIRIYDAIQPTSLRMEIWW